MNKTTMFALALCCFAGNAGAQTVHVRVESQTVAPGSPYVLAITVTDADSLAGVLLDIGYSPSMNRAIASPAISGSSSTARTRTNPAAYPDTSGNLRTGWVSFPAISGSDSILILSFEALGEPGTMDTVRVTVIDAVNQRGETLATTAEPGIVTFSSTTSAEVIPATPAGFRLWQNFPNPFGSATEIGFSIPVPERVVLEVYNVLGQRVKTLVRERREAGTYRVQLDASRLPSGIYWCVLKAGNVRQTRKLVVTK